MISGVAGGVSRGADETPPPKRAFYNAAVIIAGPALQWVDRHSNVGADSLTESAVAMIVQRSVERSAIKAGLLREVAAEEAKRLIFTDLSSNGVQDCWGLENPLHRHP